MVVNQIKPTAPLFTLTTKRQTLNVTLDSAAISLKSVTRYLDVLFYKKLNFSTRGSFIHKK